MLLTEREKEDMIKKYWKFVYSIALKVYNSIMSANSLYSYNIDDLASYGFDGLLEAMNKFEEERGCKFLTFSVKFIYGRIYDNVRKDSFFSRSLQDRVNKRNALLEQGYTEREISYLLNVSVRCIKKIPETLSMILNTTQYLESDRSLEPENIYLKKATVEIVEKAINTLFTKRTKKIIYLYFYEGLNYREIGNVYGVTEARIAQMMMKNFKTLRDYFEEKGYKKEELLNIEK